MITKQDPIKQIEETESKLAELQEELKRDDGKLFNYDYCVNPKLKENVIEFRGKSDSRYFKWDGDEFIEVTEAEALLAESEKRNG